MMPIAEARRKPALWQRDAVSGCASTAVGDLASIAAQAAGGEQCITNALCDAWARPSVKKAMPGKGVRDRNLRASG